MKSARWTRRVLTLLLLSAAVSFAQVIREDGVGSVAGVIPGGVNAVDYSFASGGGEILFATLDADVYQSQGRRPGEEEGCDGGMGGGEESGEEHGGPPGMCLQVFEAGAATPLCWAQRPSRPGWQRDPRLACILPPAYGGHSKEYVLRVARGAACGQSGMEMAAAQDSGDRPFLLNVSFRRIATSNRLPAALGQSNSTR